MNEIYKYEPRFHDEAGYWYCEKMVWMSLPLIDEEEFETEAEAYMKCKELNK